MSADAQVRLLVAGEAARVERAGSFVADRVAAMRAQLTGAAPGEALEQVLARLEGLERTASRAREVVKEALSAPPDRALELLRGYDYTSMVSALRGLEAQIQRLAGPRPDARPARATGPIGQLARQSGQLTDRLMAFFTPPTRALGAELTPPSQERLALESLEAALRFMSQLLAYVEPRLEPVACALEVGDESPGAPAVVQLALGRRKAEQAVNEAMRAWVPPLIKLFVERPPVRRPAKVATTQWHQAQALRREAEELRDLARAGEPDALAGLNAGKLRGAVMPLGHLHVTFRGIPHLQELFPPPPPTKC